MSTVKITELPLIGQINANTSNTLFMGVDIPTDVTGKMTVHTLAQGLFSNEILNVGVNQQNLPNTIAQFSLSGNSYIQTNLVNLNDNGTADIVVTANVGSGGSDSTNFIDLGYANKNYQPGVAFNDIGTAVSPLDGYLYVQGTGGSSGGNLIVGTTTSNTQLKFIVGGGLSANIIGTMTANSFTLVNTANLVVNTITTPKGSGSNLVIDPDGTADVIFPSLTEVYVQSTFQSTSNTTGALVVSGGVGVAGNVYASAFYSNNLPVLTSEPIGQAAYNQANTANAVTQSAYNQANSANAVAQSAYNQANSANAVAQSAYNQANSANVLAQSSFNKANNALANTTGTFAGDLTLTGNLIAAGIQSTSGPITTGNLIVNGTTTSNGTANITGTLNVSGIVNMNAQVILTNTSFSNTQSALTIAASNTVATPANDGYMIHISGKNGVSSRIVSDSYGTGAYAVYAARTARGNVSNPAPVQTGDIIGRFSANGFGNTKFQQFGTGRIDFVATENYTDSNTGSQIQFWNCPVGTNTLTQIASFNGASVTFAGTVQPQKGFIYTPTVYPGAQTAITIDFANNSLVRAQTSSGITATLSNLTAGKEVVAWITNTAGFSQTFTHGVSATNSTVNATTYSIPSTSTIFVRYMSIDGTLANTFCAITHS